LIRCRVRRRGPETERGNQTGDSKTQGEVARGAQQGPQVDWALPMQSRRRRIGRAHSVPMPIGPDPIHRANEDHCAAGPLRVLCSSPLAS
jgi:hypothetical protein